MILEIRKYPDPILSKKCKALESITREDEELIKNMTLTMYENNGIGLSACQVGVLKQITVVDIIDGKGLRVFVNPKIINKKGKSIFEEGCLSIPGIFLKIKRPEEIEIEFLNRKGEKNRIKANGLLARCLQQEIDHLNGILILDRIPLIKRLKLMFFRKI